MKDISDGIDRTELKAVEVDLSFCGQMNVLDQNGTLGRELQAIVDISSTRVDVSLIKGKTLVGNRSVPIPDQDFKNMFFYSDISESLKNQISENFINFLVEVLESTLFGCKTLEHEESIARIHVFGGGQRVEDLVSALQSRTEVKTEVVIPGFLRKDAPSSFMPSFHMTSLGLSLRPTLKDPIALNLHPKSQHRAKRKSTWIVTAVLSLSVLVAIAGLLLGQTYRNEATLKSLDHQLDEIKPQATRLQEIDQQYEDLSGYLETLNAIERQSPLKLPLLNELSQRLPKNTWITRVSIKRDQVEMRGYSASASNLIPLLEESKFFKDTQFKGSVTTQALGKAVYDSINHGTSRMSQNRTQREKIILTLAGSLALVYVLVEYVGQPLYLKQKRQEHKIESKILFITKYHEILNQTVYYQKKEQTNRELTARLSKLFLSPPQPALAAAELQKSLENKAHKARISLTQVKTEKTKYMEGLLTVPVTVTVKSSLEKLSNFIRWIENDEKFLVIEELTIRRVSKREPEQLESQLLVNGFVQKRRPEKLKTT